MQKYIILEGISLNLSKVNKYNKPSIQQLISCASDSPSLHTHLKGTTFVYMVL